MTSQLHALIIAVVAMGVGLLMLQAGVAKKALELRRQPRTCPSCGRRSDACSCTGRA